MCIALLIVSYTAHCLLAHLSDRYDLNDAVPPVKRQHCSEHSRDLHRTAGSAGNEYLHPFYGSWGAPTYKLPTPSCSSEYRDVDEDERSDFGSSYSHRLSNTAESGLAVSATHVSRILQHTHT